MYKKRIICFLLVFAILITNTAIIMAEKDDQDPIPYEVIIQNSPDEGTEQTENISSTNYEMESEQDFDAQIRDEETAVYIEECGNSNRYIIKYSNEKKADKKRDKFEKSAKEALNKGKAKKAEKEAARLEKFGAANYEQKNRLKYKNEKKNYETMDTQPEINIENLDGAGESVKIVVLDESIDTSDFVSEITREMGKDIEYIQPDYTMELSSNTIDLESFGEETTEPTELPQPIEDSEQATEEPTAQPKITDETSEALKTTEASESEAPEGPIVPQVDLSDRLYNLENDLEAAHSISRGEGATVAIIDTGIDINHSDLAEHMTGGWNFVNNTSEVYSAGLGLEQAHGTHVAGIIAKIASNAKIMPLKAFENGRAYTSDIIKAIEYAKENGAGIVNCSFGSTDENQALREAIENSGLLFVCAAGNSRINVDETPVYPAAFNLPNTISVASLNQDLGMSYFSNYGESVDISAVGRDVYSCFPNGEYGMMSGTSISAAYVAGAAALAAGAGAEGLKERLKNSADKLSCLGGKVYGGNKVSFYGAASGNAETEEIIAVTPEDDFDVNGYERTSEKNWELFGGLKNKQIAEGDGFTLILKVDGSVWSVGHNFYGTLGVGDTVNRYSPVRVIGLNGVESVFAGSDQAFAIKEDNTVWAWGNNLGGVLGLGTNTYCEMLPKQAYIYDSHVTSIVSGRSHTLFLENDGKVRGCGNNEYGQLGSAGGYYPNYISGLYSADELAVGDRHSVILNRDGTVLVFGDNSDGQFGNGTDMGSSAPTQSFNGLKIVDVSAAYHHTIVLTEDGTVWGTGYNENFQMGNYPDNGYYANPKQIEITDVKKIIAAHSYTLFLKNDNSVWAIGYNGYGCLGDGTGSDSSIPVRVKNLNNVITVCAGWFGCAALTSDGSIWNWGSFGGTSVIQKLPEELGFNDYSTDIKCIASGANHTIKINEDGTVSAWGNNYYGQLGNGTNNNSDTPVIVSGLQNIVEVAAGDNFSLALSSVGEVYSWGIGTWGVLGNGLQLDSNTPIKIEGLRNIVKISANNYHSLALDLDGSVYAWGLNSNGQLGVGDKNIRFTPTEITDVPKFTDISAGVSHSLAVDTSGNVWGWGNNNNYKTGRNDASEYLAPVQGKARGMKAVFAGSSHSAAISSDGKVYTWGNNRDGALGVAEILQSTSMPQNIGLSDIVKVTTKQDYTLAIDSSGKSYSWGVNTYGQLGRKSNSGSVLPESIVGTYSDIAAGKLVTYGLGSDGNLYIWGAVNNKQPTNYFEKVPNLYKIKDISARGESAAAVDSVGQVYTWGNGRVGNLGHGTDESEFYPRKVEGILNATKVAKGYVTTYVLDKSGKIWGWGQGAFAVNGTVYSPMQAPGSSGTFTDIAARNYELYALGTDGTVWGNYGTVQVQGINNVSQIECGDDFTVALSGNTVYTWGNNDKGQLGDGTNVNRETPQAIQGSYTKVFTSSKHVLAIGTDGNLYSWGWNSINQLGLNDTSKVDRNVPTKVSGMQNVKDIGTGYANSMATLIDGTVWCWGEGRDYQFGNGNNQSSWTPIKNSYVQNFVMVCGGSKFNIAVDNLGDLYTSGVNNEGQRGLCSYRPVKIEEQIDIDSKHTICNITVTEGMIFDLVISGDNITKQIHMSFDETFFNVEELPQKDGIIVNNIASNEVRFTFIENEEYAGSIYAIKLKAKKSGNTKVDIIEKKEGE